MMSQSSSFHGEFIPKLEALGRFDPPDVQRLANSTWTSLSRIKSWCTRGQLSINDPNREAALQVQFKKYMSVIKLSLDTARDGTTIAGDAIHLCKIISDFTLASRSEPSSLRTKPPLTIKDVQDHVDEMLKLAEDAQTRSSTALRDFQDLRLALWRILDPIFAEKGLDDSPQITEAKHDLDAFTEHISSHVNWWTLMNTNLKSLKTVIPLIKPDGSNPIRTLNVLDRWSEVKDKYSQYECLIQTVLDRASNGEAEKAPAAGKRKAEIEDAATAQTVEEESMEAEKMAEEDKKAKREAAEGRKREAENEVAAKMATEERIKDERKVKKGRKAELVVAAAAATPVAEEDKKAKRETAEERKEAESEASVRVAAEERRKPEKAAVATAKVAAERKRIEREAVEMAVEENREAEKAVAAVAKVVEEAKKAEMEAAAAAAAATAKTLEEDKKAKREAVAKMVAEEAKKAAEERKEAEREAAAKIAAEKNTRAEQEKMEAAAAMQMTEKEKMAKGEATDKRKREAAPPVKEEVAVAAVFQTQRAVESALQALDPNFKEVQLLTKSMCESLQRIKAWCTPGVISFDDPNVYTAVKAQSSEYIAAIELSVRTAQHGVTIAADAIHLCEIISELAQRPNALDPVPSSPAKPRYSVQNVETQIDAMLKLAQEAYVSSFDAKERFRSIRQALWQLLRPVLTGQGRDSEFTQAKQDLDAFVKYVGSFVDWWTTMNTSLQSLRTVIPQITPDGSNPIRTDNVHQRWVQVKDKCSLYEKMIQEVLDREVPAPHETRTVEEKSKPTPKLTNLEIPEAAPTGGGCCSSCIIM